MKKSLLYILFAALYCVYFSGCSPAESEKQELPKEQGGVEEIQPLSQHTMRGKVLGISKKAKTISMMVDGRTELVKYTENTEGVMFAEKEQMVIIRYQLIDNDRVILSIKQDLAELPEGVEEIKPVELAGLLTKSPDGKGYFLVDSRSKNLFMAGSIPSAVSITFEELESKGEEILPRDKDILLIFFCGEVTCDLSTKSSLLAKKLGYTNIKVMLEGVHGWKNSGEYIAAKPESVNSGNILLLDVRSIEQAVKGHIPNAIVIPLNEIKWAEYEFPSDKNSSIVIYGDSLDDAKKAYEMISEWDYGNVSLLEKGIKSWQEANGEIKKGKPETRIEWTRKPKNDEVTVEYFLKATNDTTGGTTGDVLILDVRNREEVVRGMFPNSVNIPLDEIRKRMEELPKDKEIYIHCTTGTRAEMAWQYLAEMGLRVKYLVANVDCDTNECEILE